MTPQPPIPAFVQNLLVAYQGLALFCAKDKPPILNAAAELLHTLDDGWLSPLLAAVEERERAPAEAPLVTKIVSPDPESGNPVKSFVVLWSALPVRPEDRADRGGWGDGWILVGNDVTFEHRMRSALTELRQRFKDLVEISSDFAWETDADGNFVFISGESALGYDTNDLVGHASSALLNDAPPLSPFVTREHISRTEFWLKGADGGTLQVLISALPVWDAEKRWKGARGICVDITAPRAREAELAQLRLRDQMIDRVVLTLHNRSEEKPFAPTAVALAHALSAEASLIARVTEDGLELAAGYGKAPELALEKLLLESPKAMGAGHWLTAIAHYRNQLFGALGLWRANEPWSDQDRGMVRRIAEHVAIAEAQLSYQERLLHLSEYDALTALYNRRAFIEKIEERLARPGRAECALLYLDLDNFKAVNDTNGHAKGDEVLRLVGGNLRSNLRPGDLAGRLGGDEFAVWLERAPFDEAKLVGDRLLRITDEMRPLSASSAKPLGVSVGLVPVAGGWQIGAEALIDRADGVMLTSKRSGKGKLSILQAES